MTMHHRRSVLEHVIVNASPVVSGGKLTGRLDGRLLRSGRDASTASLD